MAKHAMLNLSLSVLRDLLDNMDLLLYSLSKTNAEDYMLMDTLRLIT